MGTEKFRDGPVHLRTILEELEKIEITKTSKARKVLTKFSSNKNQILGKTKYHWKRI